MESSRYLAQAKEFLERARGRTLQVDDRRELAIEIAKNMLLESRRVQTSREHKQQNELAGMMNDVKGKAFTCALTDQCFRSHRNQRIADQLNFLLNKYGVPKFVSFAKKFQLLGFKALGSSIPSVLVPLAQRAIRKETAKVILPGERGRLHHHLERRYRENVRVNLNHLGEAILGEKEADKRLQIYLDDLRGDYVEYISVKVSTIFSQINLLAWDETINTLASRLRLLFRAARDREYQTPSGETVSKFVNLDMEEYRDLHLTCAAFKKVLDEPEFFHFSAGVVLQSYLPDSYLIQQELTIWAMQRVATGGAPIKIRLVKGANLLMEQLEAAVRGWPQAPYDNKSDVDANFKRMLNYACQADHAKAARIGVGSHNLFDIAYAMLLRIENGVEDCVQFEMLEGMADHMRRVVQALSGEMLLYCPAATEEDFHTAVAYLIRRLDENTAPENFLRAAFDLIPGTKEWQEQVNLFSNSCLEAQSVSYVLRRSQNRLMEPKKPNAEAPFSNEPDTDFSLPHNRKWIDAIVKEWKDKELGTIPLVINGQEIMSEETVVGKDPSRPGHELYHYSLANSDHIEDAMTCAVNAQQEWSSKTVKERSAILADVAHEMRKHRDRLIGAMIADAGKTVTEVDTEISEAIDFAEYYRRAAEGLAMMEDLEWTPVGTVLVAPPWNFPCAIPAGGILAALAAGNSVIFKPSRKTLYVAWELAKLFWDAGISKEVLQFVVARPDPEGSHLARDPRVNAIVLTGGTDTAKQILSLRPGINLLAETGGKNALIVTELADKDIAIKDIVQSAFGHAGQKCSACSLLILEKSVYEDKHFLEQLRDAAASLHVGSAWDMITKVNPLVDTPGNKLMGGLTKLDKGEKWLLRPRANSYNPCLWSPGIKMGVVEGSRSHQTEFFGPVLSIMKADDLDHAIRIANGTPYGLTSGLHSLDEREQAYWLRKIRAGNCYINRGITGAIVQRQPFGGCKESSFGRGLKAGGPNYLVQLMHAKQKMVPKEQERPASEVQKLTQHVQNFLTQEEIDQWNTSIGSYAYHWKNYFAKKHDPSLLQGQDNYLMYTPRLRIAFRIQSHDRAVDYFRVIAAAVTCGTPLEISYDGEHPALKDLKIPHVTIAKEDEKAFMSKLEKRKNKRIRLLSQPSETLEKFLAAICCNTHREPVLANGRIELLNYLREISLSYDYHRYGNLGERENEPRSSLPQR